MIKPNYIDYDRMASDYAQHRQVHPEVLRALVAAVQPTFQVLEVGCGTGNYIAALQELAGYSCWGIDPSGQMLLKAQEKSGRVHFLQGRAEALDFSPNQFDLVFSVDVIHHVSNRWQSLREAWRVLREGGRTCTVTDSEWVIRHRQPLSVYFPETVALDLARYPSLEELQAFMEEAGFAEIAEVLVEFHYPLVEIEPYRAKAFSGLRLIPEDAFRRGIERMERDLLAGPISCVSRHVLVWGTKPRSTQ